MQKQPISRPLVIAAAGFTAAVIVMVLLHEYAGWFAIICVLCAAVTSLPGRLRNKRLLIAFVSAIIGLLWCVFHELALRNGVMAIAETAGAGEGVFRIPCLIAEKLGESITSVFPERSAPFIRAITIGDAAELYEQRATYATLAVSGIAHIISVSGMHVSFLVSVITPLLWGRRRRAAVAIPLMVLFMAVTGFVPSIVRAVIMQSFVITAPLVRRRSDGLTSIFAALLVLLLYDPTMIAGVGLQLSFLSTLGLVLITPRMYSAANAFIRTAPQLQRHVPAAVFRFAASSFSASVGALAFSTPLVAYYFGYVSIYAPLTNLATLWASAFCFSGGLIAAILGLASAAIGSAVAFVAAVPCDFVLFAAKTISRIPFAAVYVSNPYILGWLAYLYAAGALLIAARGRLRVVVITASGAVATLCVALLLTSVSPVGSLAITVLDVGQGQSIVVTDTAATAVIDCGGSYSSGAARAAASFLQQNAIAPVDMLILTHFHYDHAGGVPELLSSESFRMLVIPDPALGGGSDLTGEIIELAIDRGMEILIISEKTVFSFGSSEITVYPPFGDSNENDACLTVLISDGEWDALITGDMPAGTELLLLEFASLPDVEMFVAGHHGSRHSSSSELLDEILPEYVVISVGANNTYGHPTDETLARFDAVGAEVYRTDISGNITVKSK